MISTRLVATLATLAVATSGCLQAVDDDENVAKISSAYVTTTAEEVTIAQILNGFADADCPAGTHADLSVLDACLAKGGSLGACREQACVATSSEDPAVSYAGYQSESYDLSGIIGPEVAGIIGPEISIAARLTAPTAGFRITIVDPYGKVLAIKEYKHDKRDFRTNYFADRAILKKLAYEAYPKGSKARFSFRY
jgi:hypothetical protein